MRKLTPSNLTEDVLDAMQSVLRAFANQTRTTAVTDGAFRSLPAGLSELPSAIARVLSARPKGWSYRCCVRLIDCHSLPSNA